MGVQVCAYPDTNINLMAVAVSTAILAMIVQNSCAFMTVTEILREKSELDMCCVFNLNISGSVVMQDHIFNTENHCQPSCIANVSSLVPPSVYLVKLKET